jgi:hypothetical protein
MATLLYKPVSRECRREKGKRPLIVTLHQDGYIVLREKGRRTSYSIPIEAAYWMAVKKAADSLRMERLARKKERRKRR